MVNKQKVNKSPQDRVVGPLPNGLYKWLINGGDPNHLLSGMILQSGDLQHSGTKFGHGGGLNHSLRNIFGKNPGLTRSYTPEITNMSFQNQP